MEDITNRFYMLDLAKIRCPNCKCYVLPKNLAKHKRTRKCQCKNVYKTRSEIGKERVNCKRCGAEVCKNKIKRHMRTKTCKFSKFCFQ